MKKILMTTAVAVTLIIPGTLWAQEEDPSSLFQEALAAMVEEQTLALCDVDNSDKKLKALKNKLLKAHKSALKYYDLSKADAKEIIDAAADLDALCGGDEEEGDEEDGGDGIGCSGQECDEDDGGNQGPPPNSGGGGNGPNPIPPPQ